MDLEEARKFWAVAQTFPVDKERVYPGHAEAHDFDGARGLSVLEYGCGGGSDTLSLLRRGAYVLYCDIVPGNVELTRQRVNAPTGEFPRDNALGHMLKSSAEIGVDAGLIDRVNTHGVLHHIPVDVLDEVLQEFRCVLRPGGEIFAMLYTEHLFKRCLAQTEALVAQGWAVDAAFGYQTDGGGIARAYSLGEGRELFERHGFEFVRVVEYNNGDFRTFRVRKA